MRLRRMPAAAAAAEAACLLDPKGFLYLWNQEVFASFGSKRFSYLDLDLDLDLGSKRFSDLLSFGSKTPAKIECARVVP